VGPDVDIVQYPEASISNQGTEAVMRFLAKECDIEFVDPSKYTPPDDGLPMKNGIEEDPYEKIVRGNLQFLDKQKEAKKKEIEAMERERGEREKEEAAIAASMQNSKKKLLNDLAQESAQQEAAVRELQDIKDKEKGNLISCLSNAENRTDALINGLMIAQREQNDPQKVLEEMEKERQEMEDMFTIRAGEADKLREQDVLRAMQSVMEEEMKREMLRCQYVAGRMDVINSALSMDTESDRAVEEVLVAKGKQQKELLGNLLEDEKYQRDAFAALFVKQDQTTRQICSQVESIQNELASLSMVEMTKKDLKVEFEKDLMKEKRETLTQMLVALMDQKDARQSELKDRLNELEKHKTEETENYWLIQYQKLLDSKPKGLLEAESQIETELKDLLFKIGADEYVPIFAKKGVGMKQLTYMNDKQLSEIGIHNAYIRQKIIASLDNAMEAPESKEVLDTTPSAPMATDEPSAPPSAPIDTFQSNECVVCLEKKCNIIFLPCGHVCCCWNCENGLTECPMCRATIAQKVRLN
jgi:E3 ubiquitin-protein ligase LRSAM1